MTIATRKRALSTAAFVLLTLAVCRLAYAIPTGSMALRTFDSSLNELGLIELRVERFEGPYLIEPLDVSTNEFGIVWLGLPAQTYAISAIGNTGEPYPGPPLAVIALPAGSTDLIVNLIVPTPCPSDVDDDRTTGTVDLLRLLGAWGPCLDCAGDTNDDGAIDTLDLLALLAAWGVCPD